MNSISFADFVWMAVIAGLIGTGGMEVVLRSITRSSWANADMVRAIGSLFTKSLNNAYGAGIVIHFISGIIFAFLYSFVITSLNVHGLLSITGAGILIGFIHGGVVSFILVAAVAEHHPLPQFQKAGFSVAVAHWIGHLVYGLLVGLIIGLFLF